MIVILAGTIAALVAAETQSHRHSAAQLAAGAACLRDAAGERQFSNAEIHG
jgi:hypothetical protein